MSLSSNWPDRPTNGSPARSSSRPGPSPTNISRAASSPTPNTTWVRPDASAQRVHPRASARTSASVPTAAWYRRRGRAPPGTIEPVASADLGRELVEQAGELVAPFEHGLVPTAGQLDQLGPGQSGGQAAGMARAEKPV